MFPSRADEEGGATTIATVHTDVINAHILTRLDGATLASASCASAELHSLSNNEALWANICHSTWPSTDNPRMRELISGGPRSFFSRSFPLLIPQNCSPLSSSSPSPIELISSVDVHYQGKLIFSKVQETETDSGWFRCSPFRIDLLDPKDVVPTNIHYTDNSYEDLADGLRLSWILVNPVGEEKQQAANLSSWKPVSVQKHWLTSDIQVKFATIISDVQCGITVTFGGEMQVREVSLQVEDMDGINLNGKESLGILCAAMEHGERRKGRKDEARERYDEYVRKMRGRRERNLRRERRLDSLCVVVGVSVLACFWFLVLSS